MAPAGFTLLELLLTLLLLAILAVIATPQWPSSLLLAAQAEQVAQDLRYTQALAMQRQQDYSIQSTNEHYYTIRAADNQTIPEPPPDLSHGVAIDSFSCTFQASSGIPNTATQIHLHLAEQTVTLQVSALTGTVTLLP
ncbi:prepilin-type N-terminal cleavage/methylation domain-containing protein [Candidatus Magnetaquicoccus inordinatus]|uniref:prepilin-type N-terminal cleavage/methylation domain-containing protein n=1 Tax=Candidatus Magnetaquicoccus inordinatus TaxID=2496818 RepID=UPI00102AE24B|nr:prepilin-type N-terminal cleavage/methylation domain-containing protein [Candidatus Magnetaquicoccus inordinatus]